MPMIEAFLIMKAIGLSGGKHAADNDQVGQGYSLADSFSVPKSIYSLLVVGSLSIDFLGL